MTFEIVFRPAAVRDLEEIEAHIAEDSPARAAAFIDRLQERCRELSTFPERGSRRDDVAPGTRMLVFRKRPVVLYRIEAETILILHLVYAGRDLRSI